MRPLGILKYYKKNKELLIYNILSIVVLVNFVAIGSNIIDYVFEESIIRYRENYLVTIEIIIRNIVMIIILISSTLLITIFTYLITLKKSKRNKILYTIGYSKESIMIMEIKEGIVVYGISVLLGIVISAKINSYIMNNIFNLCIEGKYFINQNIIMYSTILFLGALIFTIVPIYLEGNKKEEENGVL